MEPTPGPERISRRLREQFAPADLAITGLVQVLVLDALISKVEDNYTDYGVVDWLVTAATFLVCVDIWHEYLMTVLSHVWLPGLLDSLVPVAFLVTELLMVHFVGDDLRGWLLGYGLVALVGVAAWAQRTLRIRQFADEERDLPLALVTRHWYRAALAVAVTAYGLLGWLLYNPLGLDSAQLAVAAAGLVGVLAIIASSVPMWNQILRYARGEPLGTDPSGRASRTEPPR
jgi:hypothetical protein